jgi:hypothetical protein
MIPITDVAFSFHIATACRTVILKNSNILDGLTRLCLWRFYSQSLDFHIAGIVETL